jgi:hypothetical protein
MQKSAAIGRNKIHPCQQNVSSSQQNVSSSQHNSRKICNYI